MPTDWQMPRPGNACHACTREFEPGESFRACLYEGEAGYERRDFCDACAPAAEPQPLGAWTTRRALPSQKRPAHSFDRQAVYQFFRRLDGAAASHEVQFRFVLSLLLWRKKVLKLERSLTAGEREMWEYRGPEQETHRVERPELSEDELERLSGQLEQLLADGATPEILSSVAEEEADE